jgi:hypothetical protein
MTFPYTPITKYYYSDDTKQDEIYHAWERRKVYKILVGKAEGMKPLGRWCEW